MTRKATYNATDNTLTELPGPKPENHPSNFPHDSQLFAHWYYEWEKYNERLNQCRTIPCSPECRGLWAEGQVLEEGKDYEVRKCTDPGNCLLEVACVTCKPVAFPLPVMSEDDQDAIWRDVYAEAEAAIDWQYQEMNDKKLIAKLKQKYMIIKR